MIDQQLISVIVPVYNVEKYLCQCLDSIVSQTWKNLEIVLVDDGSTDGSGHICDEYAKNDSRIIVIHKANGGLSSARNSGLDIATGEYIGFVDSDDWIEPTMFEDLLAGFSVSNHVLLTNGMIYQYDDRTGTHELMRPNVWERKKTVIIKAEDYGKAIFSETTNHYVWSKLYKRTVFDCVRFREGRNDEDTLFFYDMSKIIRDSTFTIVDVPSVIYHYRSREGSIVASKKYIYTRMDSLTDIYMDSLQEYAELSSYIEDRLVLSLIWHIKNVLWTGEYIKQPDWKDIRDRLLETSVASAKRLFRGKELLIYMLIRYCPKGLTLLLKLRTVLCRN